jgi:hypothetical protein
MAEVSTVIDLSLDLISATLLLIRNRYAVPAVGVSLLFSLAAGTFWFVHGADWHLNIFLDFLFPMTVIVAWIFYFKKSRRVFNTFGRNLSLLANSRVSS